MKKAVRESSRDRDKQLTQVKPVVGGGARAETDDAGTTTLTLTDPRTGIQTTTVRVDPAVALQQQLLEAQKAAQLEALRGAKKAQIAGLRGAREGSLSALARQRGEVAPAYQQQRTGLRVQEQQLGRQTAEQAAARGLGRSGSLQQEDLARRLALQQGLAQSKAAETGALEDIAATEADVRRQYETGVAQAEAGMAGQAASLEAQAQTAAIQQQLANIQQQRQAEIQAQQLQQERAWEIQVMNQKAAIDEQLARIDAELEQALQSGKLADSIALEQEKARLRDESTRLASSLRSSGGSTGGLSFNDERKLFQDTVDQYTSGIDYMLENMGTYVPAGYGDQMKFVPASQQEQMNAIYARLAQLETQGLDRMVLDAIANMYGANIKAPQIGMPE